MMKVKTIKFFRTENRNSNNRVKLEDRNWSDIPDFHILKKYNI